LHTEKYGAEERKDFKVINKEYSFTGWVEGKIKKSDDE